jgi:hypothetical protein
MTIEAPSSGWREWLWRVVWYLEDGLAGDASKGVDILRVEHLIGILDPGHLPWTSANVGGRLERSDMGEGMQVGLGVAD